MLCGSADRPTLKIMTRAVSEWKPERTSLFPIHPVDSCRSFVEAKSMSWSVVAGVKREESRVPPRRKRKRERE